MPTDSYIILAKSGKCGVLKKEFKKHAAEKSYYFHKFEA